MNQMNLAECHVSGYFEDQYLERAWIWLAVRTVVISSHETQAEDDGDKGLKFAELAMALFLIMK